MLGAGGTAGGSWSEKILSLLLFYCSNLFFFKGSNTGVGGTTAHDAQRWLRSIGVSSLPAALRLYKEIWGKSKTIWKDKSITKRSDSDLVAKKKKDDDYSKSTSTTTSSSSSSSNTSETDAPLAYQQKKEQLGWMEYFLDLSKKGAAILKIAAVVSGIINVFPQTIIKWSVIWNIVVMVEESIYDRKHQDFQREEAERQQMLAQLEFENTPWGKIVKWFRERLQWLRMKLLGNIDKKTKEDPKTLRASDSSFSSLDEKAREHVRHAKQLLKTGKRESVTDDMLWGLFQILFVFVFSSDGGTSSALFNYLHYSATNMTKWQGVGTAWMIFLLTVIEEAVLNPKLSGEEKLKKAGWIAAVAVTTGKLVFF
ncbi:MAG: hypothetical protein SGILL_000480 [Bacillariaceae sp.]